MKYLGVLIDNKRNCFTSQKEKTFNNALKFRNQLYSVLGKCCNRLLIGKTYWKGLIIPNLLYGNDIIEFNKTDLDKLQKHDNAAYRIMLQLPIYTAVCFLRGEVGASSVFSRDMISKLSFLKHAKTSTNNILRKIIDKELEIPRMKWTKQVIKYMETLNVDIDLIISMDKDELKEKINEFDTAKWRDEMEEKSTLVFYRRKKRLIREEKWFKNGHGFTTMMKARSNTLQLILREREDGNKICFI